MHIDFVIPTLNRWESLRKTIESLEKGTSKDFSIHLLIDVRNTRIPRWIYKKDVEITVISKAITYIERLNNCMSKLDGDFVSAITDQYVFCPTAVETIIKTMQSHFPDRMGLVGFDLQILPRRLCLVSNRQYVDHFPDRYVFCPDYIHYGADKELWMGAQALKCFHLCEDNIAEMVREYDKTADFGKRNDLPMDWLMKRARRSTGYFWGRDFELIKEEVDVNIAKAKQTLFDIKEVLRVERVKFWLVDGIALGAVRDKAIIPYDKDMDLRIMAGCDLPKLAEALKRAGFSVQVSLNVKLYKDLPSGLVLSKRGIKTDMCLGYVYPPEDTIVVLAGRPAKDISVLPAKLFRGNHSVRFLGKTFRIPYPTQDYFELVYGKDWQKPTHAKYSHAPLSIAKEVAYFHEERK